MKKNFYFSAALGDISSSIVAAIYAAFPASKIYLPTENIAQLAPDEKIDFFIVCPFSMETLEETVKKIGGEKAKVILVYDKSHLEKVHPLIKRVDFIVNEHALASYASVKKFFKKIEASEKEEGKVGN